MTRFGAGIATLLWAIALIGTAMFVDRPLASLAHDVWRRPGWGVALTYLADVSVPLSGIVLIGAGIAALAGWRPAGVARTLVGAAVAVLVARAMADQLKYAFGRTWPETWVDRNPSWIGNHVFALFPFHGGRGYASFPSGHTVDIAAPAAVLWREVRRAWAWARALAVALVIAVGAGLVVSDYHFASDVLAGAYVGIVIAYGVMALIAP